MSDSDPVEVLQSVSVDSAWSCLAALGVPQTFVEGLTCSVQGAKMVGRAITMRYLPRRADLAESLRISERGMGNAVGAQRAKPGDVLVIDGCGIGTGGVIGDIVVAGFQARGGAGIVVHGAIRDLTAIRGLGVPVYYSSVHAAGSRDVMCVDFNVPVNCAGVAVTPGDILIGEDEGVLVIPAGVAEQVAVEAAALEQKENFIRDRLSSGSVGIEEAYPMSPALAAEYERHRKG